LFRDFLTEARSEEQRSAVLAALVPGAKKDGTIFTVQEEVA